MGAHPDVDDLSDLPYPFALSDEDLGDYELPDAEHPRDDKIDQAKDAVLKTLFQNPRAVYYERQILILLEERFFHWITAKALHELWEEELIQSEKVLLGEKTHIRFYMAKGHRNWRRQAAEIKDLVLQFSEPSFGYALGHQGETLFDAALPKFGFMPDGENVREYNGVKWLHSEHDLDRVFVRDGIAYGTEIKNKLNYIEREELTIKLMMCEAFGIRPLFIMRGVPKSYIHRINQAGGYCIRFRYQLYPHGAVGFAKLVRETLGIPVDAPKAISDATIQRFLDWHLATLPPQE